MHAYMAVPFIIFFSYSFFHFVSLCALLLNFGNYVFLLLCLCIHIAFLILIVMYVLFWVFLSLCCFVYCLCVNVYCTAATGCKPNFS